MQPRRGRNLTLPNKALVLTVGLRPPAAHCRVGQARKPRSSHVSTSVEPSASSMLERPPRSGGRSASSLELVLSGDDQ
jgi:hypothetical protein